MSACDELDGRPKYHVMMFHAIAPRSAPRITFGSTMETWIMPCPIVRATAVPTVNAAAKLKHAAQSTAGNGLSTRVPTTVAIEFAESWKPLLKSNRNAIAMIARTYVTTAQACLRAMLSRTLDTSSH